jgi:hypothetical protein
MVAIQQAEGVMCAPFVLGNTGWEAGEGVVESARHSGTIDKCPELPRSETYALSAPAASGGLVIRPCPRYQCVCYHEPLSEVTTAHGTPGVGASCSWDREKVVD